VSYVRSYAAYVRLKGIFLLTHRVRVLQAELTAFGTAQNAGEWSKGDETQCLKIHLQWSQCVVRSAKPSLRWRGAEMALGL